MPGACRGDVCGALRPDASNLRALSALSRRGRADALF